ncbi:MAG: hypothetical protein LBU22_10740 [Dysgonamonadaceae bacterium]|jgi:hypothetical protein|nr:hypothetical protein [Dysgonamonadaceae bacterium]
METKFTEQQSLEVITEMINRARNNVQKGSANNMIYNGFAVAFLAIANFLLLYFLPDTYKNYSFHIWWLMVPSAFVDQIIKRKIIREAIVKTHIDDFISQLWRGFSISVVVLLAIILSLCHTFNAPLIALLITPGIMIIVALAEFSMAKICRFKPFFWGAIVFWAGSLLCLFPYCVLKRGDLHFLILAVCMIVGFVIPGYILNKLAKKNV